MPDFTRYNNLRLATALRDYGLDRPLTEGELALRLLSIEMRLSDIERTTGAKPPLDRSPRTAREVV